MQCYCDHKIEGLFVQRVKILLCSSPEVLATTQEPHPNNMNCTLDITCKTHITSKRTPIPFITSRFMLFYQNQSKGETFFSPRINLVLGKHFLTWPVLNRAPTQLSQLQNALARISTIGYKFFNTSLNVMMQ